MTNARLALTLAASMMLPGPLAAHPSHSAPKEEKPRTIVVVLAHPDDELVFAPALHGLANAGHNVTLLYVTNGDQGPGVSGLEPGDAVAKARIAEAHCSMNALDANQMYRLGLGDGTLGAQARKEASPANQLRAEIGEYLDGASTVITWGPEGGYGHSDHRMVSAVVTQYVQSLPSKDRPQLLYPALVKGPLPEPLAKQGWTLTAPDLASVDYSYNEDDLTAANAAAQCHKTQFDDATRAQIVPVFDSLVWKGKVNFRPAF